MKNAWLDVFAGHGVGVALQQLGFPEYAVEINPDAIASREANGLSTPIYRDAWDAHQAEELFFNSMWLSPPCQTFSVAGSGHGRKNLRDVLGLIDSGAWADANSLRAAAQKLGDERTGLVLTPLLYAHLYKPARIVLEQVTPVLPVWRGVEKVLRQAGYSVWTGVLDAADFGVPQERKRAYLLASLEKDATPPQQEGHKVTMYEAVRWGFTQRPAPTLTGHITATRSPSGTQAVFRTAIQMGEFVFRPGHNGKPSRVATNGLGSEYPPDAVNYSLEDALALQTYPAGFKLSGTKASQQLQIGNAVPPLLAKQIITHITT